MTLARSASTRVLLLSLSLLLATTAFANNDRLEPVAHMNPTASAISWQPTVDHEKMVLIVATPDGVSYTREFGSGTAPIFRLQDLPGKNGDGVYQFELRVVPRISGEVRRQLAAARAANDDAAVQRIQHANGLDRIQAQSGTLSVINGSFVNSDADEPRAGSGPRVSASSTRGDVTSADGTVTASRTPHATPMTVVTADNEVIQGSLCVGLDCVATESFGFDTIRLKENNTRIKFDDTSTSAGFPNNDWQLTANDSGSGGANKFSIEDITNSKVPFTVTALAPTNSIFVASTGKVGFGNNNPGLNLHITATDTPAIRQEQTNGGGFTAQTWDIGANEANWFVRDVTGGSKLPLRIRPGAPTSSIDIAASGNVGLGTASPSILNGNSPGLHVSGSYPALRLTATGTGGRDYQIQTGGSGQLAISDVTGATNNARLFIDGSGNIGLGGLTSPSNPVQHSNGAYLSSGGAWTNASSRELKQDIADLSTSEAQAALETLKPVKYAYKVDPAEHHVGFIAEDVPALVATKDRKSLSSMDIVAVLTKVVQQQQSTIDELKARIDQLEKKQ